MRRRTNGVHRDSRQAIIVTRRSSNEASGSRVKTCRPRLQMMIEVTPHRNSHTYTHTDSEDRDPATMAEQAEKPSQDIGKVEAHTAVPNTAVGRGATVSATEDELEYVPDGGREAWTVLLGSTLALFASAGMINAYVCVFVALQQS